MRRASGARFASLWLALWLASGCAVTTGIGDRAEAGPEPATAVGNAPTAADESSLPPEMAPPGPSTDDLDEFEDLDAFLDGEPGGDLDALLDDESDDVVTTLDVADPHEPANRVIFAFNRHFDRFLLRPLSRAYSAVLPEFLRRAIHGIFVNLNSTSIFVNDLLQLEPQRASITIARLAINTTVGLAGMWDPAGHLGIEGHRSDFGQTLSVYGVPTGPYLVLPLVGPTTARDAFGDLVDVFLVPQTYLLGPLPTLALEGGNTFTQLDLHREAIEALEKSSVDFYVTLRYVYLANRAALLAREAPEFPEP